MFDLTISPASKEYQRGSSFGQKITSTLALFLLMGSIKVIISDEVEKDFRRVAMKRFGYAKGALSQAAEVALGEWSSREDSDISVPPEVEEDPVGAIEGLLKNVRDTSVDLQHEATKIRVRNQRGKTSN